MARNHSLQKRKKKGWSCEENRDDSSKRRAAWKRDRSQNGAVWVVNPLPETKLSTALFKFSRRYPDPSSSCGFDVSRGLACIQPGELKQFRSRPPPLIHQTRPRVLHIWTIWKSLTPEQDRKQGFSLPHTRRAQALARLPVGTLAPGFVPSKFVKPLSFQLFCKKKNYNPPVNGDRALENLDNGSHRTPKNSAGAAFCQV